jgi:hypothetical protein
MKKKFINPLTPELNPTAQRCLPRFFTGDFDSLLTARRLCKSFGLKVLITEEIQTWVIISLKFCPVFLVLLAARCQQQMSKN